MSWILYFLYLALFVGLILKSRFFEAPNLERKWLVAAFVAKIAAGFALYFIYAYYYSPRSSSDIFKYFDDGVIIHNIIRTKPVDFLSIVTGIGADRPELDDYYNTCNFWLKEFNYGLPNDNRIMIRIHAVLCLISMGNYHIHSLIFAFMSFVGLWGIYKSFCSQMPDRSQPLLLAVYFFPSVLLWTSGATKESVLIMAFGLFLYNFRRMLCMPTIASGICIVLCVFLLMMSKFYVLMAMLPSVVALVWIRISSKWPLIKFALAHLLLFGAVVVLKYPTGIDLFQIICDKQFDFIRMSQSVQAGSYIDIPPLDNGLYSIVLNAPRAFLTTLLRPSVFETGSFTMLIAGVENAIILLLIVCGMTVMRPCNFRSPDVWLCLSFVVILFVLVGLTTPVLGALVRYKVPALPFLGILLLLLADADKWQKIRNKIHNLLKIKQKN